jgi:hypothetical protein
MIGTVRQVGYKFVVPPNRQLPDSNEQSAKIGPVRERTVVPAP